MEKYIILPDVTCDLSEEIRKMIGLEDYITGFVHISDSKGERDIVSTLDWSNVNREDFYKSIGEKKSKVTTAPPTPDAFAEKFEKYVADGYKIISMSISTKISSTYEASCKGAAMVREKYPDANIVCIDSYRMSGAFGELVIAASLLKKEGKSFEELCAWIEENKYRVHQMGPIDDLMFCAKRGSISTGKAIMGSFAGVKPMGDCNETGYVTILTKAKGIAKAFDITIGYIRETATDIQDQVILVCHSNREAYANTLKEMLEKELHPKTVLVTDVFGGCGPNIGPGMIGVYYFGNKIVEGMEAEHAAINKVIGK